MGQPIRIHPDNPKTFLFRGEAFPLVTATEHYGAVMNRPFDYARYLDDAALHGMTLTRLFVLFRELQTAINPYSTCKPESPDYIAPFARTGPGKARDGEPQYDLDAPNPEFYQRLDEFVGLADAHGIVVEIVLFSNSYSEDVWALNPLHGANNVNGLPEIPFYQYTSLMHEAVVERQLAHARAIVDATRGYDNVFYEICNEPGGYPHAENGPTPGQVDAWQVRIADAIREADAGAGHLIAGHQAFLAHPWQHETAQTFAADFPVDIVNVHPLPNITLDGVAYHMGEFMSKQLALRPLRDYCLATHGLPKPLNMDEDNIASQYKDPEAWTIHRKRAWTCLLSGAHYDYIDFSIINYCESGTEASRRHIRSWMGHLSRFARTMDLARARPLGPEWLAEAPPHVCPSIFAVAGEEYAVYLPDERERDAAGAGAPIEGHAAFTLPEAAWEAAFYSPATGLYGPWSPMAGGAVRLGVPAFEHDIVLRVRRARD
jgi:hypothetical protein